MSIFKEHHGMYNSLEEARGHLPAYIRIKEGDDVKAGDLLYTPAVYDPCAGYYERFEAYYIVDSVITQSNRLLHDWVDNSFWTDRDVTIWTTQDEVVRLTTRDDEVEVYRYHN